MAMRLTLLSALLAAFVLVGCVPGGSTPGGEAVVPSGAATEVEVAPLDAPADVAEPAAPAEPQERAPAMTPDQLGEIGAAPGEQNAAADDAAAPPETPAAAPVVPEALKTPGQIACEKKRGRFVKAGTTGSFICVHQTRDGGKRCSKESDCQGLCFARSRTCSPFTPVFGCHEILQQDGLRVTQCVE